MHIIFLHKTFFLFIFSQHLRENFNKCSKIENVRSFIFRQADGPFPCNSRINSNINLSNTKAR